MAKSDWETNFRAGGLDQLVHIYRPIFYRDDYNQKVRRFRLDTKSMMAVEERVGLKMVIETKERFDYKVEMASRWHSEMEDGWVIEWNGNYYEIDHMQILGRRKGYYIHTFILKNVFDIDSSYTDVFTFGTAGNSYGYSDGVMGSATNPATKSLRVDINTGDITLESSLFGVGDVRVWESSTGRKITLQNDVGDFYKSNNVSWATWFMTLQGGSFWIEAV